MHFTVKTKRKAALRQQAAKLLKQLALSCQGLIPVDRGAPGNIAVASPPCCTESTMKASLRPGVTRVSHITIDRDRTISFMGEEARVYSTPSMVNDLEYACRDLIVEHADVGEDSVGMGVAVTHLAPTLPGMTVEITVRVAAVEGRKVSFELSARDDLELIGTGTHSRFVVDTGKTVERLKAKAAKHLAGAGGRAT
jgi:fluoroacetyl-CoA thioesterase